LTMDGEKKCALMCVHTYEVALNVNFKGDEKGSYQTRR